MKKLLLLTLVLVQASFISLADDHKFFQKADEFFKQHVSDGLVDYKAISQDTRGLQHLVKIIANYDLANATAAEKKAFYINAYNILVIDGIIQHYPTSSPLKIDGFFKKMKHKVSGRELTLSELENEVIRKQFPDARVHFVLVCAAKGCPPLINEAYQPKTLDEQLETQTNKALNKPKFVEVDRSNQIVNVSSIFDWYKQDFVEEKGSVIAYINQYRKGNIPESYAVKFKEYDWQLNAMR